jgi:kinetochore protein Mis13/DSN1
MTAILTRNPLQTLHMASTNRPNSRRRSTKREIEEEDAPAPKRPKTELNGSTKSGGRANSATKRGAKGGEFCSVVFELGG